MALIIGGIWAYLRFVRTRESAAKVDLDVDLSFIRKQGANWIVEGVALVKNPGSVRLDFKDFTHELHYALASDNFGDQSTDGGNTKETTLRAEKFRLKFKSSWLEDGEHMYLEPGERSRYSFLASLPADTTMVLIQCEFYDTMDYVEIVRKSYAVPPLSQ